MARKLRGYGVVRQGEHGLIYPTMAEAEQAKIEAEKLDAKLIKAGWGSTTPCRFWIETVHNRNW